MGDDTAPEGLLNFCKRSDAHFKDSNILKCCLGEKEVLEQMVKTDAGHQYCPRDFCRTNIKFSKVDADEMTKCEADEEKGTDEKVCYKLSDKCNVRLKKICDRSVFFKERKDWKKFYHIVTLGHKYNLKNLNQSLPKFVIFLMTLKNQKIMI